MEEIREVLAVTAQSTRATTSAAEAVKKAVEDKKSSTTDWSKLIAERNLTRTWKLEKRRPGVSSSMDC